MFHVEQLSLFSDILNHCNAIFIEPDGNLPQAQAKTPNLQENTKSLTENIVIKSRGRFSDCEQTFKSLKRALLDIRASFSLLGKKWEFSLPDEIILRPLYTNKRGTLTNGLAGKKHDGGYFIAMNVKKAKKDPRGFKRTSIHEACHIAAERVSSKFDHGRLWKEMFEHCKKEMGIG